VIARLSVGRRRPASWLRSAGNLSSARACAARRLLPGRGA